MSDKIHVVGIGASAGGQEAISQLIGHLKPDLACAYVVLQHLSPSYPSMMVEILGRETSLSASKGQPATLLTEAKDITLTRQAVEQLRITARVFDQAGEASVVTDAKGIIHTVNAAFTTITGYSHAEVVGQPTSMFKSGRHSKDFYRGLWESIAERGFWQGEIWNKRKNGEIYPEWITINRVDSD